MTLPTSGEVVETRAEAAALPWSPLVVLDALADFLDVHGIGRGRIVLDRIGEGHSNITYALDRGEERLVLRRGPRPPIARSTHDMLREARTQRALRGLGIPVPEIVAVCADESVMGVPFYVMRRLDGDVVTGAVPAHLDTPAGRAAIAESAVDVLAALHAVPVDDPDIAALGRPHGYLERQLAVFAKLWAHGAGRSVPDFDIVAERLHSGLPTTSATAVVHGDFRLGNLMYAPAGSATGASVAGVLDWEMSTLGDPLADLGYLLATWSERGEAGSVMELSPVTRAEGFPSRHEIAERYAARTGRAIDLLPWYQALALWKAAVFCEEIYQRWLRGERSEGASFARALEHGVPDLLRRARTLL